MHRHGYKGRKLGRERDQRRALIKGLADSLIIHGFIETTSAKAKELVPYTEKLITRAKKGDLASRRMVISSLQTVESAHKLVDDIAPKLSSRTSGHLRMVKTTQRRGDNAQLAKVSFVDDLTVETKPAPKPAAKPTADKNTKTVVKKTPVKKPAVKKKAVVNK